ncbi:unnamed protein product [Closterium sp. Yama58-4]|nr:unnamed protein product [Closterium sp. Yama58-4]
MPGHIPDLMPGHIPDLMPGLIPDHIPGHIPDLTVPRTDLRIIPPMPHPIPLPKTNRTPPLTHPRTLPLTCSTPSPPSHPHIPQTTPPIRTLSLSASSSPPSPTRPPSPPSPGKTGSSPCLPRPLPPPSQPNITTPPALLTPRLDPRGFTPPPPHASPPRTPFPPREPPLLVPPADPLLLPPSLPPSFTRSPAPPLTPSHRSQPSCQPMPPTNRQVMHDRPSFQDRPPPSSHPQFLGQHEQHNQHNLPTCHLPRTIQTSTTLLLTSPGILVREGLGFPSLQARGGRDFPNPPNGAANNAAAAAPPVKDATASSRSGGGTILGAVALIIGTSVGAGVLALPAETAPAGVFPSSFVLIACWAFLCLEALLLAEVNVALIKDRSATLGPVGGTVATVAYVFLSFTLIVAYFAKGGEVLAFGTGLPNWVGAVGFFAVLGGLIYSGSTRTADIINRVLTAGLLGIFTLLVCGGAAIADWDELAVADWSEMPTTLPVIFLALVFHDLIPVICTYLDANLGKIRATIVIGSAAPLTMFLVWDAIALSISPSSLTSAAAAAAAAPAGAFSLTSLSSAVSSLSSSLSHLASSLPSSFFTALSTPSLTPSLPHSLSTSFQDPLNLLLLQGSPLQSSVVLAFSFLAVATSFLGTSLALAEFFMEQLGLITVGDKRRGGEEERLGLVTAGVRRREEEQMREELTDPSGPSAGVRRREEDQRDQALEQQEGGVTVGDIMETGLGFVRSHVGEVGIPVASKQDQEQQEGGTNGLDFMETGLGFVRSHVREVGFLLALCPPLLVALANPGAFVAASKAAGAYGMTVLYGIMPPLMFYAHHKQEATVCDPATKDCSTHHRWLEPGGSFALASMGACAFSVIAGQALLDSSLDTSFLSSRGEGGAFVLAQSDSEAVSADPPASRSGGGTILGAVTLIIGSSVGAGVLALPSETAPAGFFPSSMVLIGCWAFLVLEALLLAEVNVSLLKERSDKSNTANASGAEAERGSDVLSYRTMAEATLGPLGGTIATAAYLFLSFTLMVAYFAKGGEVMSLGTDLPRWVGASGFATVLGGLIYCGNTRTADLVNRALTAALLGIFAALVCGGSTLADWDQLGFADWSDMSSTLPVIFLALVFHDLVPVLCAYLDADLRKIRTALLIGSSVPLAMFLTWDAIVLSISPTSIAAAGAAGAAAGTNAGDLASSVLSSVTAVGSSFANLASSFPTSLATALSAPAFPALAFPAQDPFQLFMHQATPLQSAAVLAFSFLAVATSFLGSSLALSEFYMEQIGNLVFGGKTAEAKAEDQEQKQQEGGARGVDIKEAGLGFVRSHVREVGFLLALCPPLAVALANPGAFVAASKAAGAYGMTVLYGILPPLMFYVHHKQQAEKEAKATGSAGDSFWVQPGGSLALASMGGLSCAVIAGQAMIDASVISPGSLASPQPAIVLAQGDRDSMADIPSRSQLTMATIRSPVAAGAMEAPLVYASQSLAASCMTAPPTSDLQHDAFLNLRESASSNPLLAPLPVSHTSQCLTFTMSDLETFDSTQETLIVDI